MKAILFVDDHQVLARLSCEILETQGYRAEPAFSGADALEKLDRKTFDVLVTDYRMEGMNGLELAQRVHEGHPGLPIIMVTAYGPVEGEGISACLQKEELFPALLEKIEHLVGEKPEAQPVGPHEHSVRGS